MELSIFLAQLYAVALLAIGLGLLFSSKYYVKAYEAMMKEAGILYFGGVVALIVGFLIVTRHNVWQGWPTLITLFGWIALLKGVLLLVFPGFSVPMFKSWVASKSFIQIWGFVAIVLGLFLGYFAFL